MKLSLATLARLALPLLPVLAACTTTVDGDDTEGAVHSSAPTVLHAYDDDVVPDHLILRKSVLLWSTTKNGASASTVWRGSADKPGATQLAEVEGRVFQMSLYGANLFIVPDESGGIVTLPATAGAKATRLYEDQGTRAGAEGLILSMTATIDGVFAARDDGNIVEVMRDGSLRTAKTGAVMPRNLTVWEDTDVGTAFVFYVDNDETSEEGDTQLVYAALKKNRDGAFELPQSGWKSVRGLARANAVTTDRDNLYIATWGMGEDGEAGEILVAPADGSAPPRAIVSGVLRPTSIVADERGIYFTTGPGLDDQGRPRGGAIMAISKSDLGAGSSPVVRCFGQGTAPAGLAQNKSNLYWVSQAEKQIVSWNKAAVWAHAQPCETGETTDEPRAPAEP